MSYIDTVQSLRDFLQASVSPYHVVEEAARRLSAAGFRSLSKEESWTVQPGDRCFIRLFDSCLAAFRVNPEYRPGDPFRITASHIDWPCMRIKPAGEFNMRSYKGLSVEVYGGPILNTWLDRPLSIAGHAALRGKDPLHPVIRLVDLKKPVAIIPNLAVHYNRDVNKGKELNPETELRPLVGHVKNALEKDGWLIKRLAEELSAAPEDVLHFELYLYNKDAGEIIGWEEEFFSSPRLDNITSVHASVEGLIQSSRARGVDVAVLYDNEEIGSETKQGARTAALPFSLEKLALSLGVPRDVFLSSLMQSLLLSMDVGHAIHPNFPQTMNAENSIDLNQGFVIKTASSQRYSTDSEGIAIVKGLADAGGIPYKVFCNRGDVRGGGTLGSMVSVLLAARTVDIGVPILSMHSARELMGVKDQQALLDLVKAFYSA